VTVHKSAETIQGQKLFAEIRYLVLNYLIATVIILVKETKMALGLLIVTKQVRALIHKNMVFAKLDFRKYPYLLILHEIQTIQRFSISGLMYKFLYYILVLTDGVGSLFTIV
jgi:hypothetical protein